MKVAGLDLGIVSPGMAWTDDDGGFHGAAVVSPKTREKSDLRLAEIDHAIRTHLLGTDFVLIESGVFSSKSAFISGMVHGVVRLRLIEMGTRYATISPPALKKYATGKGTADKTAMTLEAYKRAGLTFTSDDACDAWWLWVMANDFKGQPVLDLPQVNRESLSKIKEEG